MRSAKADVATQKELLSIQAILSNVAIQIQFANKPMSTIIKFKSLTNKIVNFFMLNKKLCILELLCLLVQSIN